MNGHTFLRSYRVLMLLGMVSFMTAAFYYSVPHDYDIEEYLLFYAGAQL